MKHIPRTEHPLILRTDFSDQTTWEAICDIIREPVGEFGFRAYVEFLNDREYAGLTEADLPSLVPKEGPGFIMIVDRESISLPDHPVLIVDLWEVPGRAFRAIPSEIQSIENNLSIANMDLEEFADSVDTDGVFRGFPNEVSRPQVRPGCIRAFIRRLFL